MAIENVILNDGRVGIQLGNADDGETDGVTNENVSLPLTTSYTDNSSEFNAPQKHAPRPSWFSKLWDDNIKISLDSLVGSQATLAERFSGGLTLLADAAVAVNVVNPVAWLLVGGASILGGCNSQPSQPSHAEVCDDFTYEMCRAYCSCDDRDDEEYSEPQPAGYCDKDDCVEFYTEITDLNYCEAPTEELTDCTETLQHMQCESLSIGDVGSVCPDLAEYDF